MQQKLWPSLVRGRIEMLARRLPPGLNQVIGSVELVTLGAILLIAGGIWGFVELADEIAGGEAHAWDRELLLLLRNPLDPGDPVGPPWLESVFRDVTALGGYTVIILAAILAFGYLGMIGNWLSAWLLVLSLTGATIANNLLKFAFERQRPDFVAHLVEVTSASFPSGHAMLSAIAYLSFGALLARAQPRRHMKAYVLGAAVLIAVLVGISRVYLGVHWPSDVLAGWCLGAAWAIAFWLLARLLEHRPTMEGPR